MRPLLATILCVWEIWSGSNTHVYMYHVFHREKKRATAQILKLTYDQKPETFFLPKVWLIYMHGYKQEGSHPPLEPLPLLPAYHRNLLISIFLWVPAEFSYRMYAFWLVVMKLAPGRMGLKWTKNKLASLL